MERRMAGVNDQSFTARGAPTDLTMFVVSQLPSVNLPTWSGMIECV